MVIFHSYVKLPEGNQQKRGLNVIEKYNYSFFSSYVRIFVWGLPEIAII